MITWKWAVLPGAHVLSAWADVNDAVWEPDESDNRLSVEYPSGRVGPPPQFLDISVDNVTYRQSANGTDNATRNILTLVVSITNSGQQDLPSSFAAILADSLFLAELPVPPLVINSTVVLAYPWNAPVSNHTVKVVVDYRHQFPEDIETENDMTLFIGGNNPPMAYAGGNRSAIAGEPVTFRGFAHDNIDGYIALYEWDFDGDGTYDYNSTVSAEARHVYHTKGTYTARLRVTDDRGATAVSSALVVVRLREERPLIRADELTLSALIIASSILAGAAVMIYRKRDEE